MMREMDLDDMPIEWGASRDPEYLLAPMWGNAQAKSSFPAFARWPQCRACRRSHRAQSSVEAFFLALNGGAGWEFVLSGFFLPVLIGNIIGGTALFGLIAYGQVAHEFKG